ncbi:hydantoinase/oxoprolinase family protein, partial [Pantoea conspicua]|uniref:hydantoinase/oxoprolinase family protein n=1 Tax=Pantoea conspicua TaxID=472705 RepID=UPI00244C9092
PRITKSNGGVMGLEQAKRECVQMVLSGTASGVIGASYLASACGFDKILSLDIGGTSADVAVIVDGTVAQGNGEIIGDFPIFIPSVAVTSVGQGGGSLAWIDGQGVLQMGPDSA